MVRIQRRAPMGGTVFAYNIVAGKNKLAWDSALEAAGNRDYTPRIFPKANHIQLEAKVGSNAETASLRRFVPRIP